MFLGYFAENRLDVLNHVVLVMLWKFFSAALQEKDVQRTIVRSQQATSFENFKSVLYGYYSQALAINYDPDSPRRFKSICLKCNAVKFLDQEISCCM